MKQEEDSYQKMTLLMPWYPWGWNRGKRGLLQAKPSCRLLTTEDLLWQHASANVLNSRFGITCKFGVKPTTENRDGNKDGSKEQGVAEQGSGGRWRMGNKQRRL